MHKEERQIAGRATDGQTQVNVLSWPRAKKQHGLQKKDVIFLATLTELYFKFLQDPIQTI